MYLSGTLWYEKIYLKVFISFSISHLRLNVMFRFIK